MTPLKGVRVLDLSRLLPGPWASLLLSDLGAEVIKVEAPQEADDVREFGAMVQGQSVLHRLINRGKKSLTLNLKSDAGRRLFLKLVETADVVLESFRPGVLDRLGIGFESLRHANSTIILCSLSGYGQSGPRRDDAGHDINFIGYSGILGLNGNGSGVPIVPSVPIADLGGGSMAVISILAGLWTRQFAQEAQWIDVSMLDSSVAWLPLLIAECAKTGQLQQQTAVLSGGYACYTTYPTSDQRFMCVGAVEPKFWQAFCETLNVPKLIGEQFAPIERQREMKRQITEKFLAHPQQYWIQQFESVQACCTPVLSLSESLHNRQITDRAMVIETPAMPYIGCPLQWVGEASSIDMAAADLGEDTADILAEINVSVEELQTLKKSGTI